MHNEKDRFNYLIFIQFVHISPKTKSLLYRSVPLIISFTITLIPYTHVLKKCRRHITAFGIITKCLLTSAPEPLETLDHPLHPKIRVY